MPTTRKSDYLSLFLFFGHAKKMKGKHPYSYQIVSGVQRRYKGGINCGTGLLTIVYCYYLFGRSPRISPQLRLPGPRLKVRGLKKWIALTQGKFPFLANQGHGGKSKIHEQIIPYNCASKTNRCGGLDLWFFFPAMGKRTYMKHASWIRVKPAITGRCQFSAGECNEVYPKQAVRSVKDFSIQPASRRTTQWHCIKASPSGVSETEGTTISTHYQSFFPYFYIYGNIGWKNSAVRYTTASNSSKEKYLSQPRHPPRVVRAESPD